MDGTMKIQGKAYKYAFNQKARRLYMEAHGIEYWDDFAREMEKMNPHPEKGMSLSGMMVFSGLVISAMDAVDPDQHSHDQDTLLDALIQDPKAMESLMKQFSKAMEQLNQKSGKSGNKSVPSSSGKKSKGAGGKK